jgi:lipoprotein-anchoring transpeptidase ErfK/SrfK
MKKVTRWKSAGKLLIFPAVFSLFLIAGSVNAYADDQAAADDSSAVFIYRMYNSKKGGHLYTASYEERNNLALSGWTYEGIGWIEPSSSSTPVYRLYNARNGDHFFTASEEERAGIAAQRDWRDEGVAFYSDDQREVPVYRASNVSGQHSYTTSAEEISNLTAAGWNAEDIAWYAANSSAQDPHPMTIAAGIDFSAVYDYTYFRDHHPDVVSEVGSSDAALITYFAEKGMDAGLAGKENYDQGTYDSLHQQVIARRSPMLRKAWEYSSPTGYLILTDQSTYTTAVFTGSKGNWTQIQSFPCAVGAGGATPDGVYSSGIKELYFGTNAYRCWYATQISGNYLYHSTLYKPEGAPLHSIDDRTGRAISHGCIRLPLDDAKWLHDNIPRGTTIVIYHS